jgi:hypothetical protein
MLKKENTYGLFRPIAGMKEGCPVEGVAIEM